MKNLKTNTLATVVIYASLLTSVHNARTDETGAKGDRGEAELAARQLTSEQFVQKAALAGMAEIDAAKLARQNAESTDLRMFAGNLVRAHTSLTERLREIAQRKGYQWPDTNSTASRPRVPLTAKPGGDRLDGLAPAPRTLEQPDTRAERRPVPDTSGSKNRPAKDEYWTAEKLQRLQGADFDRAFLKQTIADHKDAVALFAKASERLEDQELKAYAANALPKLKTHLEEAEQLSVQLYPSNF